MCTTGCPSPGSHQTWGECLKAKAPQFGPAERNARLADQRELQAYYDVRMQGIQPKGTRMHQIEQAKAFSDVTQVGDPWQSH